MPETLEVPAAAHEEAEAITKVDVKDIMESISGEEGPIFKEETEEKKETPTDDETSESTTEKPTEENTEADEENKNEEVLDEQDLIDDLTGTSENKKPVVDEEQVKADEALLKDASEETVTAFKSMREKITELNAKIASGDDSDTVKELRAQINTLESKLGEIDLTQDPTFKRNYTAPIAKELKSIGSAIKEVGGDPNEIINRAMSFKSKIERKQFLQKEVPAFATELSLMFTRVDGLIDVRKEAMSSHVETKQKLAQSNARSREESVGKLFDTGLADIQKSNHFLFTESEKGSEKWNLAVQNRVAAAKSTIANISEDETALVSTALKASVADDLLNLYLSTRKSLLEAQRELGVRKAASPSLGGDSSKKLGKSDEKKGEMSAEEAADAILGKS